MNSTPRLLSLLSLLPILATSALAQNSSSDEALSKILVPGQDWQLVGEGYGFTDGACADAQGNFYFADLPKGVLHRVTPEGNVSAFLENGPKISGLKFGPDGKLYAATQGPKKQIVAITPDTKEITVLADEVTPNDLVVSHKGHVYFTDTGKGRVTLISWEPCTTWARLMSQPGRSSGGGLVSWNVGATIPNDGRTWRCSSSRV